MTAEILVCSPEHYDVTYMINPWMHPDEWAAERDALRGLAHAQWDGLAATLIDLGARLERVPPQPGLPDLVFTANAAVVLDGVALLARFRHRERQGEEPHFAAAFERLKAMGRLRSIVPMPAGLALEGAGDCVWDPARRCFWMGWGMRSSLDAAHVVERTFGRPVHALELVDPRFYHMDTALRPLPDGSILFVPEAFDAFGHATIAAHATAEQRIAIAPDDAARLAANAVLVGDTLVMAPIGADLVARLRALGYGVAQTPLDAFHRGGGSAFCLTLRLDLDSAG